MIFEKFTQIFWDWNGTLLDDLHVCVEIMNEVLDRRNLPPLTVEKYLDIFEFPVVRYYEKLGFDLQKESFEKVGMEFIEIYQKKMFECPLHSEVIPLLEETRRRGIPQSILSALQEKNLQSIIAHFQLGDFFRDVRGLTDHYAKGKIDLGRDLLRRSGHPADKTVLIGDTLHDYDTARELGIHCILVGSGHNSISRLKSRGVPVVTRLGELIARP